MSDRGAVDFDLRMARIEGLVRTLESSADAVARDTARELTTLLLDLHREGLTRMLDLLARAGEPGRAVAEACTRDDLLASLLALHDLGPRPAPPKGLVPLRVPGREATWHDRRPAADRCELCGAELSNDHPHLREMPSGKVRCACRACATLFEGDSGRYRRVQTPER